MTHAMSTASALLAAALFTPAVWAIEIGPTSYPNLAAALAAYSNGDVIEIEPDDSGVIEVSAAAVSGKAINFEAGSSATLLIDVQYAALSSAQPTLPLYNISGITVVGEADPEKVWEVIEVTGTTADKFKLFWSNQDAQYYSAWPVQSVSINEVGVQIGNLYAAHLAGGAPALLDTVQTKASGTPNFAARRQSLHDNILGNLGDAVIAGRFPGQPDPRSSAARAFGSRPFHDGVIANGLYTRAAAKTALSWDLAAGIDYFDDLPALFGNTIAIGSSLYTNLADAVSAATANATIRISAGSYTQTATLNLATNGLTLQGAGQGATIVTSQASGYGILWTANDVAMRDLSYRGPTANAGSSYGLKIQPGSSNASQPVQGVNIVNVTVSGSGRSEIDLHYVDGAVIRNVTADGDDTAGAGVALTASRNVTLENLTTSGNKWGAVAVYTKPGNNTFTGDPATSSHVTITNLSFDEAIALYGEGNANSPTEDTQRGLIPDLAATQFTHTVRNAAYRSNGANFTHYRSSASDAQAFAAVLHVINEDAGAAAGAGKSVVTELGTGHFIVSPGLAIQAAVDTATAGATVVVDGGTYAETVKIDKPLALTGAGAAQVTLAPTAGNGIEILGNTQAGISGIAISGMTIDAPGTGIIALSNTVPAAQYDTSNISIDDVTIRVESGNKAGIGLFDVDGAVLSDVTITGHDATAVGALELVGVRNLEVSKLVVAGASRSIKLFEVDGYADNGSVTIRDSQLDSLEVIGTSASVDARQNWWGSAAGPAPAGKIIGSALFRPWAVDAAMTALSSAAAELELIASPGGAQAGAVIAPAPAVRVTDHEGAPVAGVVVTAQLDGGGTLGGTTALGTNPDGSASFGNLVVGNAGVYTLTFSAPGVSSVTSASFTISAAPQPSAPDPVPQPEPLPEPEPEPTPPELEPEPEPEPPLTDTLEEIVGTIVIPPPQPGTGLSDEVIAAVGQAAAATTELAELVSAQIDTIDTDTAIDALTAIGSVVDITGAAAGSNAAAPDPTGTGNDVIASGAAALDSFSTLLAALDAKTNASATPAALSDVQKDAVLDATLKAAASAVQILSAAPEPAARRAVLETLGEIISSNVNLGIALSDAESNTLLTAADRGATPDADTETLLENSVPLRPHNSELITRELLSAVLADTGISAAEVETLLAELGNAINPADIRVGGVDGEQALLTGFTEALDTEAGLSFDPETGTTFFTIGAPPAPQQTQPMAARRLSAQTLTRTIPARIVSSNIVSAGFPDGIVMRPDGSAVITSRRIAALVVPAPHDPIRFFSDLRSLGNVALDASGNLTIVRPGILHLSGTFDFLGTTPGGAPVPVTRLVPTSGSGNASDPAFVFTVTFRDGTTQTLQPFIDADSFIESLRQHGLGIAIDRGTGIIAVNGERFRPDYFVKPHNARSRAWWSANKDASGLAYRPIDVNGDGLTDFEVHSATGVQLAYRLAPQP